MITVLQGIRNAVSQLYTRLWIERNPLLADLNGLQVTLRLTVTNKSVSTAHTSWDGCACINSTTVIKLACNTSSYTCMTMG
jgi:hypothetical protein